MNEETVKQHWGNICHPDDFAWSWDKWHTREPFDGQVRIKVIFQKYIINKNKIHTIICIYAYTERG